ncbi:MAG: hypothetical protein NTW19_20680 [Planctomycetota bacterium]|nr:hypothetical protein [Planctomycetota bacterium]
MKRILFLLALVVLLASPLHAAPLATIHLNEYLGGTFSAQALHYAVEAPRGQLKELAKATLRDPAGQPVLAQFKAFDTWDDGSVHHLEVSFVAGLNPNERKAYTLDDSGQPARDDGALKAATEGDNIVFSSPLVAVKIPALNQVFPPATPALKVPGPISQVRGKAKWYGRGWIDADMTVKERAVKVVDDGPIYKRAAVEYTFANGEKYVVEVMVNRGEELVRVKEDFTLPFTDPSRCEFNFDVAAGLSPDKSVAPQSFKPGPAPVSVGSAWDLQPYTGEMFPINYDENAIFGELTPWSVFPNQWVHWACYQSAAGGDMLGVINTAPEKWDHIAYTMLPGETWKLVQNPHAFFTFRRAKSLPVTMGTDKSLTIHFKLTTGHREWAFFVSDAFPRTEEVTEGTGDKAVKKVNNAAPRDFFKQKTRDYCLNALDRLKDYTLEWPTDKAVTYPRLYADKAEYEAKRGPYSAWWAPGGPERIPSLNDKANLEKIRDVVLRMADETVKIMLVNPRPPHHITQTTFAIANVADLVLGSGTMTPEQEASLRAKMAFMAYVLNWRGYWAPEKGYAANPNMSSFCYDGVGLLGMVLADHPESKNWINACTTQLDRELDQWASPDGAWLESIHYTLAAWNEHSMSMAALKHLGIKDYYRHPKTRKFLEYYLSMQTPPDPQFNNQRGIVQIGNSYVYENVDDFAMWAKGIADADPTLAGNLMWMWREHGFGNEAEMKGKKFLSYGAAHSHWWASIPGAGGLPPYYELALKDPTIKPIAPAPTGGKKFSGFGAVLQSHVPSGKETKMFFREGQTYSHWDMDQGHFVLWAKGAPLCMDHGYGEFHPWFHNKVDVNHMWDDSLGDVTSFFAGVGGGLLQGDVTIDMLSLKEHAGVKDWPMKTEPINGRSMTTPWTRRILFLNDADPDGPNYFVVRDVVRGQLPSEWTLWAYGEIADFESTPIRAKGKFGVDLLVYLLDKDRGKVGTGTVELPADRRKQTLIHLRRPAGRGVLAVLFPALPAQEAPKVTPLAGDLGAKVEAPGRTDWVFMPESRAAGNVDGVEFDGIAASFSRRGKADHYMVERFTQLTAQGLGVRCNFPVDLMVSGNTIKGAVDSQEAVPVLVLTGPVAQRVKSVTIAGKTEAIVAKEGKVEIRLPLGPTGFEVGLR